MAKSLQRPPPSSTVARLLDAKAAARATAVEFISVAPAPECPAPVPRRESVIKRELTLSPATDETFSQLIELYRRATSARVSASHVARAILAGVARCLPGLQREADRIGRLRLPSNARGRERDREQLEQRIADAFVAGISRTWRTGE